MKTFMSVLCCLMCFIEPATARMKRGDEIKGVVSYVFDGDTISLNEERIRFQGLDCPELMQFCKNTDGSFYKCGEVATEYLKDLILDKALVCLYEEKDQYKRIIATCYIDGEDINASLVKSGNAIAMNYDKEYYVSEEKYARENQLGMWQGKFTTPHQWRMKFGRSEVFKF